MAEALQGRLEKTTFHHRGRRVLRERMLLFVNRKILSLRPL
jgi:hypothetical protein